ncbi:MAG: ABC transporter permease [Bacteroidota bacterium]|jgi:putative ABC transport system permease protein
MLWIVKIAWKNCWRNPTRTLVSMAAVFFAVILSTLASSLKEGIFNNLVKNVVSFYSGYIQIHAPGYWEEQNLDNSFEDIPALNQIIKNQPNISSYAPRLESYALVASEKATKGCMIIGIDAEAEHQTTDLKNKLIKGKYFDANEEAILCAEGMAKRLSIQINDTVFIIGQGFHGSTAAGKFYVKGFLHFGSPELNEQTLFLPLSSAQNLFSTENRITSYTIQIQNANDLVKTTSQLKEKLIPTYEVMSWEEMMPDIKQHIETDSNNMKYIQGILYLLICFGILGTLIMMMMERKYEMGMLIAIGMKKRLLMLMIMAESIITIITGCILGIAFSIPLIWQLHIHPLKMSGETAKAYEQFGFEAIFPTSTNPDIFLEQGITVIIIALILCIYPLIQIIRLKPVEALKRNS